MTLVKLKHTPKQSFKQPRWLLALTVVLVPCLIIIWTLSPWGQNLEEGPGLDALFILRGHRPAPKDVIIVAITELTPGLLNLAESVEDWPRSVYTNLLNILDSRGAKVIAFDVFFEKQKDHAVDTEFATTIKRVGDVVLFAFTDRQIMQVNQQQILLDQLHNPLPLFTQAAATTAPFTLPKTSSKVTRYWLRWEGQPPRWTLPAAAFIHQSPSVQASVRLAQLKNAQVYNYYGPPRSITTLALEDVLAEGKHLDQIPENTAFFVGYASHFQPNQRDSFYTPFTTESGHDISGVELAATAYANLQEGSFIRYQLWAWVLTVLVYTALLLVIGLRAPLKWMLPSLLATAIIYAILAEWLFSRFFYWLPVITPLLILTPALMIYCNWQRLQIIKRQKLRLETAFGHYLPATEIEKLAKSPDRFAERERLFGVCLVTDAENYTTLAETLDPLKLGELLEDYYQAIINPIRQHGGIISDVAGDGIIALWPHLDPKNIWQTLSPALDALQASIIEFNRNHPEAQLPTRIGVHAGDVILGHFGASDHFEYRAIGDLVNTTSRIENANKTLGTKVLISESCLPNDSQNLRRLGHFILQGKQQPLALYSPIVPPWTPEFERRMQDVLKLLDQGQIDNAKTHLTLLQNEVQDSVCEFYLGYGLGHDLDDKKRFIVKLGKRP